MSPEQRGNDHPPDPNEEPLDNGGKDFHPWRLLGVLIGVLAALALIAAVINVAVLGW